MSEQASKMWSGRFREPLDRAFEQWQRSFPFDWRLIAHEVAASKAHAKTIAAAGILTDDELAHMLAGLDQTLDGMSLQAEVSEPEDIHHFVELVLTKHVGDLALKLHTGRSRNEQIAIGSKGLG
jgi:argininosuccinate lyase